MRRMQFGAAVPLEGQDRLNQTAAPEERGARLTGSDRLLKLTGTRWMAILREQP